MICNVNNANGTFCPVTKYSPGVYYSIVFVVNAIKYENIFFRKSLLNMVFVSLHVIIHGHMSHFVSYRCRSDVIQMSNVTSC